MPSSKPTIYLIAGCNGAGKTTFAKEFLPYEVKCLRFYNADEIARGLSPLDPSAGDFKAGRLLLTEVRSSIARRETFALESTLSGKTYVRTFGSALANGYELELHYLWLANPEQANHPCPPSSPHGRPRRAYCCHPPALQAKPSALGGGLPAARHALGGLGQ